MSSFGTTTLYTGGRGVGIVRAGVPTYKEGGITLDWTTVAAAATSDTTLADDQVVPANHQYLRYGTVITRITSGASANKFGPYSQTATDGRQDLTPGDCFLLPYTVVDNDPASDHPGVIDAGDVFPERITDLTANPDISDLRAAFPRVQWGATD
jgi:hypothetical protein